MDGSTSTFLYDTAFLSPTDSAAGILYMEDFDAELRHVEPAADPVQDAAPSPTQADLDSARAEGREEGLRLALADAAETRAQLEAAALQSLADSLAAARVTLERIAAHHAAECARTMLALMLAAIPETMRRHGQVEIQAVLDALLPGFAGIHELRVSAHPELADSIREHLAERLPPDQVVLCVVADSKAGFGDVEVAWQHGHARRDCKSIWQDLRTAMAPMNLPTMEVCRAD